MAPHWRGGAQVLAVTLGILQCCGWLSGQTIRTSVGMTERGPEQWAMSHERVKRGWVWNQFFVVEEYTGTEPLYVGKIHSDSDEGDGSIKYTISGEGAGTIFIIDEVTGDIHATERLDREEKTFYTLRAQARDRLTDGPLEPESEFVIKVQDINDSEPKFLEGPYVGSVAELSPIGTSVMKVMASDADDPTYGSSARIVYSVLDGERFFTVDRQTGVIRTAVADLDRETQDRYELVVKATDMAGQMGGLSGSTTVTIVITDVNDNPPRFPQKMYQFSVSEGAGVGTPLGRVIATDADMGENTDMSYLIKDEEGGELFRVSTDGDTQEAIITIKKPLDFESKRTHNVVVEAVNKHVDPRFKDLGSFRDQTIVRVSVSDVDEPPIFIPPAGTIMEVQEDARMGVRVGTVIAKDPDMEKVPVRYNNTAGIRTQRSGFNRQEQNVYLLPILVVDSGPPALSSTGTLTIHVCGCDPDGAIQSCNATAYVMSTALSPGALIALLVCILILIVLVLLILTLKRHRKGQRMSEDEEDMRDNVIKYNDEGGGEQDTQAYDMSALRNLYDFPEVKSSDSGPDLRSVPQWIQNRVVGDGGPADFTVFKGYIRKKVEQADADLSVPPYDSFQTYAFEGSSSPALSLSSIRTLSTTSEQDFSYLSDWGPRFRQLAGYYAPAQAEEEGS
ncbi:unnamed protein product [Leuciscus chuanchicus]